MKAAGATQPIDMLLRLRIELRRTRQRRLWVCAGAPAWTRRCAQDLIEAWRPESMLCLGGAAASLPGSVPQRDYRHHLGREYDLVLLDAHAGLDVDALAAVAGTLRGGGLLVLLTPALADWPAREDAEFTRFAGTVGQPPSGRFLRRLIDCFADPAVALLEQDRGWCAPPLCGPETAAALPVVGMSTQDAAVAAIVALARGHVHPPPLVLSAPRGRGKSAALGMAAAGLPEIRILVTAPRRDNCEALLRHARAQGAPAPRFVPPDELLRRQPPADLLLIDEAAAIPLSLLERLVQGWPRVALATTVQGYEGTGRGFELKFFPCLDRIRPGWRLLRLHAPARWAADDPLERWLDRALLLDADLLSPARLPVGDAGTAVYARLDRSALPASEPELRQLFGLLVSAHYRTRPSDLRQLLDTPGLEIHVLRQGDSLLAAALTVPEGPLPADLIPAIFSGRRRLRGQLIAQSLVAHVGCEAAGRLRGRRVMRIAVHPQCQGRGLGSRLLRELEADARHRGGVDWLGASFGLDLPLLAFWRANGYAPLRLGLKREASSGLHAALLLKTLAPQAQALVEAMSARFQALLPLQLADGLERLEPELAQALLQHRDSPPSAASLSPQDWAELAGFAFGRRGYEVSLVAITRLLHRFEDAWMQSDLLDAADRAFLTGKCLQHRPWRQLVETHRLDGVGAARERLREILRRLLNVVARERIEVERVRLETDRAG